MRALFRPPLDTARHPFQMRDALLGIEMVRIVGRQLRIGVVPAPLSVPSLSIYIGILKPFLNDT